MIACYLLSAGFADLCLNERFEQDLLSCFEVMLD